jgi:hypothetical protein
VVVGVVVPVGVVVVGFGGGVVPLGQFELLVESSTLQTSVPTGPGWVLWIGVV